jgi:hypothetical protein
MPKEPSMRIRCMDDVNIAPLKRATWGSERGRRIYPSVHRRVVTIASTSVNCGNRSQNINERVADPHSGLAPEMSMNERQKSTFCTAPGQILTDGGKGNADSQIPNVDDHI